MATRRCCCLPVEGAVLRPAGWFFHRDSGLASDLRQRGYAGCRFHGLSAASGLTAGCASGFTGGREGWLRTARRTC